jgi:hypothetical protein
VKSLPVACPWSLVLSGLLPPLKTGRLDIDEILLKVALNTISVIKSKSCMLSGKVVNTKLIVFGLSQFFLTCQKELIAKT